MEGPNGILSRKVGSISAAPITSSAPLPTDATIARPGNAGPIDYFAAGAGERGSARARGCR